MGKLIEKLRKVSQGPSGSMGFSPRRESVAAARPAAVIVSVRAADVAQAEAAVKGGADAIVIAGWKPGANLTAIKAALSASATIWGVQYDGAGDDDPSKAASEAGAAFMLLGAEAAAGALFDEVEKFDRIVTISAPRSELDFLTLRVLNALPAQAALVMLPVGVGDLAKLPVPAFVNIAIVAESLRFPLLAAVNEAPDQRACRALVRLGVDGVLISGVGVDASKLGTQIRATITELEKTPPRSEREGVNLSGLLGGFSSSSNKPEPSPTPEREPDEQ